MLILRSTAVWYVCFAPQYPAPKNPCAQTVRKTSCSCGNIPLRIVRHPFTLFKERKGVADCSERYVSARKEVFRTVSAQRVFRRRIFRRETYRYHIAPLRNINIPLQNIPFSGCPACHGCLDVMENVRDFDCRLDVMENVREITKNCFGVREIKNF